MPSEMSDLVNGLFESVGGLFIAMSCRRLYVDKRVRGVSPWHAGFFAAWGWWNLYFYWSFPISWWGGIGVVAANTVWLGMIAYYIRAERREVESTG